MKVSITNTTSQPKLIPLHTGKNILAHRTIEMDVTKNEVMLLHKMECFCIEEIEQLVEPATRGILRFEDLPGIVEEEPELPEYSNVRIEEIEYKLDAVMSLLREINFKLDTWEGPAVKKFTASEMLNMEINPQESRRALFQKIVDQNKELHL